MGYDRAHEGRVHAALEQRTVFFSFRHVKSFAIFLLPLLFFVHCRQGCARLGSDPRNKAPRRRPMDDSGGLTD